MFVLFTYMYAQIIYINIYIYILSVIYIRVYACMLLTGMPTKLRVVNHQALTHHWSLVGSTRKFLQFDSESTFRDGGRGLIVSPYFPKNGL